MPRSALLSRSLFSALLVVGVPDILTAQQPAGVFTAEQTQSGHSLYDRNCAACHGIDLEGSGDAPPLAGGTFMLKWGPKMSSELFGLILQTMPVWQKYSCDIAVILHQSTKALAATHSSPGLLRRPADHAAPRDTCSSGSAPSKISRTRSVTAMCPHVLRSAVRARPGTTRHGIRP